ncbi:lactonase family protein [Couchioplanes azureus]|uniref:lactonase family protein n=1 Tax=Couchioplanes caeruleus TaxID=56438 RepID=UPI0016714AF9|nr:beta-propeller fold lactonase family protein [Couchioplanes caeruleus]GGQ75904.1 hypothetical protein GCM10010166_52570 [Couchioplanes caeruleus subsp. azureus]
MAGRHARATRGRPAWVVAALLTLLYLGGTALMPVSSAAFTATTTGPASTFPARSTFGLTQTAGCLNDTGTSGCTGATGIVGGTSVVVSPDGKHVYVGSVNGDSSGVAAFSRNTTTGALTQLASPHRCYSNVDVTGCTTVQGLLLSVYDLAISPDGRHVYAVAFGSSTLVAFSRNATTGALTPLSGTARCLYDNTVANPGGCTAARKFLNPDGVIVSPDGAYVYVASHGSDALTVLARNATTGALTQPADASGCYTNNSTAGTCTLARGMDEPYYLRTSPDGTTVYVAAYRSNAIAIFQRNMSTGVLMQPASPNGCVYTGNGNANCTLVKGLSGAYFVGVAPDGATVYGVGNTGGTVAAFTRNATSGLLTQLASPNSCVYGGTMTGCTTARAVTNPVGIAFSPDGLFAFVPAAGSDAVAVFRHNNGTGVLTQLSGTSGCVALTTAAGCTAVLGMSLGGATGTAGIAVSPDGRDVYVAGGSANGSVAVLNLSH